MASQLDPAPSEFRTGIAATIGDTAHHVAVGHDIQQAIHIYQQSAPRAVDAAVVAEAQARLAALPLDVIPPVAPLPPGSHLPIPPNPLFVGRSADLLTLARTLHGGGAVAISQVQTAATTGWGGVGKTQLAAEFAHRYGSYFAGGVFWLSFADPAAITPQVAACGGIGRLELRTDFGSLKLEDQLRLVLAAWQDALPRLLIFDSCEDPELLSAWRPPSGACRILVTSRRSTWARTLGVQLLALDVLARQESVQLLDGFLKAGASSNVKRQTSNVHVDRPADAGHAKIENQKSYTLDAISAELGDLPLALHLAGSYLETYRFDISPEVYLEQLRRPSLLDHPSLQGGGHSPTGHVHNVGRTFALSYDRLQQDDPLDNLALRLLACAACFAPGLPIPRSLLLLSAGIDVASDERLLAADALHRLGALGLLESVESVETVGHATSVTTTSLGVTAGALRLHRLLVHFVRSINRDAGSQTAVETVVLDEANRLNNAGVPAPLLTWQAHLRHVTDRALPRRDAIAAGLANTLGYHLQLIGDLAAARYNYEQAVAIYRVGLGEAHPDTATSLNNLGMLLHAQGDLLAARPYLELALAVRRRVWGEIHPETAQSLNNLGLLLQEQGDLAGARPYYEQALAIRRQIWGEEHPDTANSLNNLGSLLQDLSDLAGARPCYEQALTIRRRVLGETHPATAASLSNLGSLLRAEGDYAAARPYYEQALAIRRAVLGESHTDTARSLNNLGSLLRAQGDLEGARPYYEQALAIRREAFGEEHPATATSLNNLGALLQAQGNLVGARPYFEQALAIRRRLLGEAHPDTATSLNNLGSLLQAQGDLDGARPYLEQAVTILTERLGPDHPRTQTVLRNLAALATARDVDRPA
jgi:tetratricopeptide (TPR) repeat protein